MVKTTDKESNKPNPHIIKLVEHIGNYYHSIKGETTSKKHASDQLLYEEIVGNDSKVESLLYKGASSNHSKDARKKFVEFLAKRYSNIPTPEELKLELIDKIKGELVKKKNISEEIADKVINDFKDTINNESERKSRKKDIKKNIRNKKNKDLIDRLEKLLLHNVIMMTDLLGEDGTELYSKAIEEERNSKEYRKYVLLRSAEKIKTKKPKDNKKKVIWIGGPSGSGKSYAKKAVVENINEEFCDKSSSEVVDNMVVSVDGGIDRECSQMRSLVLQLALTPKSNKDKNFYGIYDLHDYSKLGTKFKVKQAALKSKNVNVVVIPATFTDESNPLKKDRFAISDIVSFKQNKDVVQIFSEVVAEPSKEDSLKRTVKRLGESRAFGQSSKLKEVTDVNINNPGGLPESKVYNSKYYNVGGLLTGVNKKWYESITTINKTAMSPKVVNDLIFVRRGSDPKTWVECAEGEKAGDGAFKGRISRRDLKGWQAYIKDPVAWKKEIQKRISEMKQSLDPKKEINKAKLSAYVENIEAGLDLPEWYQKISENDLLSGPWVVMEVKKTLSKKLHEKIANINKNLTNDRKTNVVKSSSKVDEPSITNKYTSSKSSNNSYIKSKCFGNIEQIRDKFKGKKDVRIEEVSKNTLRLKKVLPASSKHKFSDGIYVTEKKEQLHFESESSKPSNHDINLLADALLAVEDVPEITDGNPKDIVKLVDILHQKGIKPKLSKSILLQKDSKGKILKDVLKDKITLPTASNTHKNKHNSGK